MPLPISSWHQVPPEYRDRVKQAMRDLRPAKFRRRFWIYVTLATAAFVVCFALAWVLSGRQFGSGFALIWIFALLWNTIFTRRMAHEESARFARAVRSVGLEAADPPPARSWRERWHDFAPPAKGQVDRDWSWVQHRRQRILQRIDSGLMWRYKEEMYRRRFRIFIPISAFLFMLGYIVPMAMLQASISPFIKYFLIAFVIALFIGWCAFYFIHESWRPTWAALNGLGAPTCMRCGYDLTEHAHRPCPECGAPPGEEVVWSERIQPFPASNASATPTHAAKR